ncbi:hypothetical protein SUGI_0818510 [Cryptomeria japonica]|nr:hypothetical protein SUGI_0818510 [Cryptomeria japonica]
MREREKGEALNLNLGQGGKPCNGQANQGEKGKDDSRDCPDSSKPNGKDPVDGDPQVGNKSIDPDGENGESRAGDIPRQEPVQRDSGRSWTSLFRVKPSGKSTLPPVRYILDPQKGRFAIEIPNPIIEHNINLMEITLVGKKFGLRPNIDIGRAFSKRKWALKGQVEITAMSKGALSMDFSCKEDMSRVLCDGPWLIGKSTLALQKWSLKMDLNESFFVQAPV